MCAKKLLVNVSLDSWVERGQLLTFKSVVGSIRLLALLATKSSVLSQLESCVQIDWRGMSDWKPS